MRKAKQRKKVIDLRKFLRLINSWVPPVRSTSNLNHVVSTSNTKWRPFTSAIGSIHPIHLSSVSFGSGSEAGQDPTHQQQVIDVEIGPVLMDPHARLSQRFKLCQGGQIHRLPPRATTTLAPQAHASTYCFMFSVNLVFIMETPLSWVTTLHTGFWSHIISLEF